MPLMTKKQILEETIAYYDSPEKFGYGNGQCQYLTKSGAMCAVGRCLVDPKSAGGGTVDDIIAWARIDEVETRNEILDRILKPEYRGHEVGFWVDLQNLHDYCAENSVNSFGDLFAADPTAIPIHIVWKIKAIKHLLEN